ncbi:MULTISPECIES: VOC family protein, partial [Streptomyces]
AMDVLQWSRHYRCFPGQGGLDVTSLVRHAVNAGYRGPLSLEVFNDVFRQADAGSTAVDALRSLIALEESAGISPLPAPVVPTGVAFAELATADPLPVTTLLTALGFRRTGRHTGKPVDLWEQGDARILVNHGTGTLPYSRLRSSGGTPIDGTSLTAIGLETPDPSAAAHRAESLLAPVLPRRRSSQDVPLDAVAAPDGTELFFCVTGRPGHADWTSDFTATANPRRTPSPDGTVTGFDHVALTQPWHHFDEAVLFHRAVLGLRPHESVDLADPYGLFRSRALTGAHGAPRLVLNLAPSPATDTRTRSQHIALTTDDITAAARRTRAAGAELLKIPANYYEDLDARYDFAPGELDTYQELGILYDRDEHGGEFRHCYTATVGRVFFEIVQRTAGYGGYGAANASVRLAAQRR